MKNIELNILRIVLVIMLLAIYYIIFAFSNQNGEQSGSISRKITIIITENIKSIQKMKYEEREKILRKIEFFIRKLAHFSLYTMVGLLAMSLFSTYCIKLLKKVTISLCLGLTYAISDEIHQNFIPGRASSIKDVGIDTLGVIFGIILVVTLLKIIKKYKKIYYKI